MLDTYSPHSWFWVVGNDTSRAWSSTAGTYVTSWPADRVTRIASEAELTDVLRPYGLAGPHIDSQAVDAERDRRIAVFPFGGKDYDADQVSLRRIDTAKVNALAAIINGAQAGDYRWAHPTTDFAWIASDNTSTLMDAQTTLAFGIAASSWEGLHIVAARSIKNLSPVPTDYASAARWP